MAISSAEKSKNFRARKKNKEGKKEIRNQWVKFENFEEAIKYVKAKIRELDGDG